MKPKRFSEEQLLAILKELEAGVIGKDTCRRHGPSEQTLYRWKAKFGGAALSDAKRLKQYAASLGSGAGRQKASGVSMRSIRTRVQTLCDSSPRSGG